MLGRDDMFPGIFPRDSVHHSSSTLATSGAATIQWQRALGLYEVNSSSPPVMQAFLFVRWVDGGSGEQPVSLLLV